ncbi:hypothetical protein BC834DRAFT_144208 [Gloeopeniophorella convolvens]|nr:hypothetical protein BC834DRAFT_144208 [Gloeopeniophorella convolvens]
MRNMLPPAARCNIAITAKRNLVQAGPSPTYPTYDRSPARLNNPTSHHRGASDRSLRLYLPSRAPKPAHTFHKPKDATPQICLCACPLLRLQLPDVGPALARAAADPSGATARDPLKHDHRRKKHAGPAQRRAALDVIEARALSPHARRGLASRRTNAAPPAYADIIPARRAPHKLPSVGLGPTHVGRCAGLVYAAALANGARATRRGELRGMHACVHVTHRLGLRALVLARSVALAKAQQTSTAPRRHVRLSVRDDDDDLHRRCPWSACAPARLFSDLAVSRRCAAAAVKEQGARQLASPCVGV